MNLPRQSRDIVIKFAERVSIAVCSAVKITVELLGLRLVSYASGHLYLSITLPSLSLWWRFIVFEHFYTTQINIMTTNMSVSFILLSAVSTASFKGLFRLASLAAATFSSALMTNTLLDATEDPAVCWDILGEDICEEVAVVAIDALNLEPEFPRVSICSSVITDIELCNVRSRHSTRGSVLYMYIFCPRERNE